MYVIVKKRIKCAKNRFLMKGVIMPVLHVTNLTKTFTSGWWPLRKKSSFTAVNGISFALEKGEILGFLGPNGAGKTTTIEMLLGTLTPSHGKIKYFNKDFAHHRSEIMQKVTFASAYVRLPSRLSVMQNLDIFARLYGLGAHEREKQIITFLKLFGMWEIRHQATGSLSAGQMTRVMLAKAFISEPEVVLLDEPTASLDPDIAQEVRTFVLEQKEKRGISVLFTSHNMHEVTQVCDRVMVLQRGTIIANATPLELAASVKKITLALTIIDGLKRTISYAQQNNIPHRIVEREIHLEVSEEKIAEVLMALAHIGVSYSQISIDKPTLEDYFLNLVKQRTVQEGQ